MGWFGQAWVYAKGWLAEARTQKWLYVALYVFLFVSYFPISASLGTSLAWGLYWLTWVVALFAVAYMASMKAYEAREGKTMEEQRRETWMALGAAQARLEDTWARMKASEAQHQRNLAELYDN